MIANNKKIKYSLTVTDEYLSFLLHFRYVKFLINDFPINEAKFQKIYRNCKIQIR